MKVVLVNDTSGCANWGDRAAGVSLRSMIAAQGHEVIAAISEEDLAHTWFAAHGPPAADETDGGQDRLRSAIKQLLPPVVLGARRRFMPYADSSPTQRLIPAKWEDFDRAAGHVTGNANPWPDLMRSLEAADVVFIHGDGALVGFGIAPRTILFLAYVAKKYCRKPVVIANHTADLDDPRLLSIARQVYPLFDDVVFRDPISLERSRGLCDGRYAADTAFWFTPAERTPWLSVAGRPTYFDVWPDTAAFDPSKPYICVGGSSIFGVAGNKNEIVLGYSTLIEGLQASYTGQIVLVVSDFTDEAALRPVARRFGLPLVSARTPVQQAVDILANAEAYVGGRWHAAIFALRGGTPVVPLSARTFKMRALVESAGLRGSIFDALELRNSTTAISDCLQTLLDEGATLRNRLRYWADERAENCWENTAYLRSH